VATISEATRAMLWITPSTASRRRAVSRSATKRLDAAEESVSYQDCPLNIAIVADPIQTNRRRSRASPRRRKLTKSRIIRLDPRLLAQWPESQLARALRHRGQTRVRRFRRAVLPTDPRALHAGLVQMPPSQDRVGRIRWPD
jgi:hypothetical protein